MAGSVPESSGWSSGTELDRIGDWQQGELLARLFDDALQVGHAQVANCVIVEALELGMSVPAIHVHLIEPAMQDIGELWLQGRLGVADEHMATAIVSDIVERLARGSLTLNTKTPSREHVLLAAVEGERHVLGLRMVADDLTEAGYDVAYLGADVPVTALARTCDAREPDLVGLSVTLSAHLPAVDRALAALAELRSSPVVIVGGAGAARMGHTMPRDAAQIVTTTHSEGVVPAVARAIGEARATRSAGTLAG
jgi:methanogenic corrinoid protein MtbC1